MNSSTSPAFDGPKHKRSEREGYNLIAERYQDAAPSRQVLTEALLAAADLAAGQSLLDLASGPGVLGRAAQPRVAPGAVVLSDLAEQALVLAARGSTPLLAVAADAESLPFADASFDRVLCGLGLMFFPDEQRALAELRRVLRPQGKLALSVWADAERVPLVACALACIKRLLPAPKISRPGPCRLGADGVLLELLLGAGYTAVEVSHCDLDLTFASSADYWNAFRDLAGGAASGLSRLPAATLERFPLEVASELEAFRQGSGYRLVSRVLIATATRPG